LPQACKQERDAIYAKADHDHHMEHNIIYGAIIIAIADSLNFKCSNNRKSYSSLHMIEMQIINLKTLAAHGVKQISLSCSCAHISGIIVVCCEIHQNRADQDLKNNNIHNNHVDG
jgi:hypothetical protein